MPDHPSALDGFDKARKRRRAEREAVLATPQSFGLINRTRGPKERS